MPSNKKTKAAKAYRKKASKIYGKIVDADCRCSNAAEFLVEYERTAKIVTDNYPPYDWEYLLEMPRCEHIKGGDN